MSMKITSIKDPRVEEARSLQSVSGRKQHGKALLYGLEQLKWALQAGGSIEHIFIEEGNNDLSSLPEIENKKIEVSSGILKKISDTQYVIPCLSVVRMNPIKDTEDDFIIVLDSLQDFGNIGSVIRTSKGFSINNFLFSNMQTDAFQRKIIDASRGMVFRSRIIESKNPEEALAYLKKNDYQIIVTSPHGKNLQSQTPLSAKKVALIIGNETSGACDEFIKAADTIIQIPMNTQVESLNASVSAGISIYELKFKQVLTMLKEKILSNFGRELNITGKLIRMAFDAEIKKFTSVSGIQVILLMIMHTDKTMSKTQIAKDVSLFGDELDHFLASLLQHKYVTTHEDSYSLTSDGERFIAEIWPIVDRTHEKIMVNLSTEETVQLKHLLSKVQQGCREMINNEDVGE